MSDVDEARRLSDELYQMEEARRRLPELLERAQREERQLSARRELDALEGGLAESLDRYKDELPERHKGLRELMVHYLVELRAWQRLEELANEVANLAHTRVQLEWTIEHPEGYDAADGEMLRGELQTRRERLLEAAGVDPLLSVGDPPDDPAALDLLMLFCQYSGAVIPTGA